jgi:hypothetical protein
MSAQTNATCFALSARLALAAAASPFLLFVLAIVVIILLKSFVLAALLSGLLSHLSRNARASVYLLKN